MPQQIQAGEFAIAFVKTQHEVDTVSPVLVEKPNGDGILWLAYPKGSFKKHTCGRATLRFNRDTGQAILGNLGLNRSGW